jgi:hypothetical protein
MTVTGAGVTWAPAQEEAFLWACAAATAPTRFPATLRGVLVGVQTRLIVALTHAASTEYDEDVGSDRRLRGRCGRRGPICAWRDLTGRGPAPIAGPSGRG